MWLNKLRGIKGKILIICSFLPNYTRLDMHVLSRLYGFSVPWELHVCSSIAASWIVRCTVKVLAHFHCPVAGASGVSRSIEGLAVPWRRSTLVDFLAFYYGCGNQHEKNIIRNSLLEIFKVWSNAVTSSDEFSNVLDCLRLTEATKIRHPWLSTTRQNWNPNDFCIQVLRRNKKGLTNMKRSWQLVPPVESILC